MILSHRRLVPRAGFSLLELLAVVSILVVLIGVGGVMYFRYIDESKEQTALAGITNIETAVMAYRTTHGDFPPDLTVLTQPEDGRPARLEPRHLADPWGNPYMYEPGNVNLTGKPRIYSQGPRPGDPTGIKANW